MLFKKIDKKYYYYLPIFATEEYLLTKSDDYGWFISDNFILPYFVNKKLIFKYIVFPNEIINLQNNLDINAEKIFLDSVIKNIQSHLKYVDFVIQSPTNVVFNTYPTGSIHAPFGSYQIKLTQSEDILFANLHSKHRNVVRKAIKDGVIIEKGSSFQNDAFELVLSTMIRQKMNFTSKKLYLNEVNKIKENLEFYLAKKDGEIQGSAIIYWNENGAYYVYGGSIENPYGGSLNLMHWEIIKDMKSRNVKLYDFVGARLEPKKGSKLEGIQRFKSRFGATMKKGYLWKYPIKPLKYKLFELLKKINAKIKNRPYIGDIIDQERNV